MADQQTDMLKQLLTRGWMTHDAMWYRSALEQHGSETANQLNKSAIRQMAPLEVRRIRKALGISAVSTLSQLRAFLEGAFELLIGDFMHVVWQWKGDEPEQLRLSIPKCFAREGIIRLGAIDRYECGIFERICAWLDALQISYEMRPKVSGCLLERGHSACSVSFSFQFPSS